MMLYPYVTSMFDPTIFDEATYYYHVSSNKSRQVALYAIFEKDEKTGKYTRYVDSAICFSKFGSLIDAVTGEEYIGVDSIDDTDFSEKVEKRVSKKNTKFNGSVRSAIKYTIYKKADLNKIMGVISDNNPFGKSEFPRKQLNVEVYNFEKQALEKYCAEHSDLNGNPIYFNFGYQENNFDQEKGRARKRVETI